MKLVAVSLRVDKWANRDERRDTLAKGWAPIMQKCDAVSFAVPNEPGNVVPLMDRTNPDAILLSGGNDLVPYGGDAPERDAAETAMIEWAVANGRAIIGVCRGMEMVVHAMGGTLKRVEGHIGNHVIRHMDGRETIVNSWHRWAVDRLPTGFCATAFGEDAVLEACRDPGRRVECIMWHPERCSPVDSSDLDLIRRALWSNA